MLRLTAMKLFRVNTEGKFIRYAERDFKKKKQSKKEKR
jgi:hypothetical protein